MKFFQTVLSRNVNVEHSKAHLKIFLLLFVVILAIPISILIGRGYEQSRKDEFYKYQWSAKQVVHQINDTLFSRLQEERHRPFDEYSFYKISQNPAVNTQQLTLSPLASIPDPSKLPGIIGYFQVDDSGLYSCPHLPLAETSDLIKETKNLAPEFNPSRIQQRLKLRDIIRPILLDNNFIHATELQTTANDFIDQMNSFGMGSEEVDNLEGAVDDDQPAAPNEKKEIIIKVDQLQITYASDHKLIFHRDVWRGNDKLVQGFVVNSQEFLIETIKSSLFKSNFRDSIKLNISFGSTSITDLDFSVGSDGGSSVTASAPSTPFVTEVYRAALLPPFQKTALEFSVSAIPLGIQSGTITLLLVIIIGTVIIGFFLIYKIGSRQIDLNRQQLNFVSSISHELKTPLTSILLYAEMLRENMVICEGKKADYYDYIFFESERLSRLISNVLRLSKLEQNMTGNIERVRVSIALSTVQGNVRTLLENQNFQLRINCVGADCDSLKVLVDLDAFTQIFINLIDNAVKFSKDFPTNNNQIDLCYGVDPEAPNYVNFKLRDYGPGVAKEDSKHIFDIFYRAGDELTRKTQGTGIGLSLVKELVESMSGVVKFRNTDPGTEFTVQLPLVE